ncbi:N-formylglutamate amidohydrolase [Yoonia sp. SS1-5]|uniref:N-formylglutamate amidohydrolase n=1 Tax=Yoonia rhodophyticola TaxID=3137370 RepID=A0AAN0MF93_9RHOB
MSHPAYEIIGQDRPGRWIISCDHASNHVPDWVSGGDLGLPAEDMQRHIAYDIGAAAVATGLAAALDSPALLSRFSRLVIDPNRGERDPTLLMQLNDGSIIPGNRFADASEKARRLEKLYHPYHAAYAALAQTRDRPVICAIHSFTRQYKGRAPRPWEVGVLYGPDPRLAKPFLQACIAQGWCVGDNQPYQGHFPDDAVDKHALQKGRPNLLIEIRQDLIQDQTGQALWVNRLAPILTAVLAETGL